jgi:isopentenyldiphosphate isomerase
MNYAPVVIVDEEDRVIGAAPLKEVWKKGWMHRIVRIMVEDTDGRVLLQKRSKHMELFPECWDHSAAGHVDEGDSYEQAAERELQEELGISGFDLKEIAYYPTKGEYKERKLSSRASRRRARTNPR